MDITRLTFRHIAKSLASRLPLEGEDYSAKVTEYLGVIKAMPKTQKVALRCAFIFSRKVPREEREDFFQELILAVLKANTGEEKLAYAIARCDWKDWWKAYTTRQHFFGGYLSRKVENGEGGAVELAELLVGECEFENKMSDKLRTEKLWAQLPDNIRVIVGRRLQGFALTNVQRAQLSRWVKKDGTRLLLQPA